LGRVVGKRWGNAVQRNRYRRWIREAFRLLKPGLPGIDLVVMPYNVVALTSQIVEAELESLAARLAAKMNASRRS
jgi:ribonuclease P protein component